MGQEPQHQRKNTLGRILRTVDAAPSEHFERGLLDRLMANRPIQRVPDRTTPAWWNRRTFHRVAGSMAAILLVAAGIIWFAAGSTDVAHADFATVLRRVNEARTVSFDSVYRLPGGKEFRSHVAMSYPGRSRITLDSGKVQVFDRLGGTQLTLKPLEKMAILRTAHGQPAYAEPLESLRAAVESDGHLSGTEYLDSAATDVYEVVVSDTVIRVWVDPKQQLPVRIESRSSHVGQGQAFALFENFRWNEELPESLFAMQAPSGYTLSEPERGASAQSLIDLLTTCVEGDGPTFPASINIQGIYSVLAKKHPLEFADHTVSSGDVPGVLHVTGAAKEELKMCILGLEFIKQVAAAGEWHYTGSGVRIGDPAAVVCWWKQLGADRITVVYGNLTIKEMTLTQFEAPLPRKL